MEFIDFDLATVFQIETSVLELIIRGSVLYLGILFLFRVLPRRTGGELAMMDLIFVLLIAEAATHSMGSYESVTEGFVVIGTLMAWNYAINFLSYHIPFFENIVSSPPLLIVRDGKLLRRNMRREYLTEEELMDHLRIEGVDDIKKVKSAFVEGDGKISVVSKKEK